MWLLLRLAVMGLFSLARYYWRNKALDGTASWRGEIVYQRKRAPAGASLGVAFHSPLIFELLSERRSDRWLKKLSIIVEQQTGDSAFDASIYIRSDNPNLGRILGIDADARAGVLSLLGQGARRIISDGLHLWIDVPDATASKDDCLTSLRNLRDRLDFRSTEALNSGRDPSFWRVAVAEIMLWAIAGYAAFGVGETLKLGRLTLDLVRLGTLCGIAAVALSIVCLVPIAVTLRRSSWAPKVYWEAATVLTLSLPLASVVLVSDVNRAFDRSPLHVDAYQIIERKMSVYQKPTRREAARTFVDYLVQIHAENKNCPEIWRMLPVPAWVYYDKTARVEVTWGQGALGIPWIASIQPVQGQANAAAR